MLLLGLAAVVFFLSLWIVIPAPNLTLLALGVGVPELSPLLLLVSAGLLIWAVASGGTPAHRAATGLALVASLLLAVPLAQLPGAVQRANSAMVAAGFQESSGRSSNGQMRERPVMALDFLRGITTGGARIDRRVPFATQDGVPLMLDVYRPLTSGHYPVLVQIYGGAWQRGEPANDPTSAQYFASHGYVVFAVDYRHAPRWRWPAQLDDIHAALTWIRAHADDYDADATRLALMGRSSGAQLALSAAYREASSGVSAVVGFYGPTNLTMGWREPPRPDPLSVRSVLEAYLGGTPDGIPERYMDASPVALATADAPPTLLIYGGRDHIVELRFGRELAARLHALGARSVLLELPWAEHAFDAVPQGLSGQIALYYTERFLAAVLAAPSPS